MVADDGDAARHVEQFLAQPPDVHQHDDGRETVRPPPDGPRNASIAPIRSLDVDEFFFHRSLMFALLTIGPQIAFSRFIRSVTRSGRTAEGARTERSELLLRRIGFEITHRGRDSILATISGDTPAGATSAVNVPVDHVG